MSDIDISCFSCSRGRVELLRESISRMYSLAKYPDRIEYVVRIDDDDIDTIEFFQKDKDIKKYKNIRVFVGPRVGFHYLWLMFYQMFEVVVGDIIVPYSEDAIMHIEEWDEIFRQFKGQSIVFGYKARLAFTREAMEGHTIIKEWNYRVTGGGDAMVYYYARKHGLFRDIGKWYARKQPNDKTREDVFAKWMPDFVPTIDNLDFIELKIIH